MDLDKCDRKLLSYLGAIGSPQTTRKISERAKIGWKAARDHLEKLKEEGYVKKGTYSEKPTIIYWRINDGK